MPEDDKQYDKQMRALSHPLRRQLLRLMLGRPEALSPREASRILDVHLHNVSYHLRVLANCAAVTLVATQPVRGSVQHFYRPAPAMKSSWARAVLRRQEPTDTATNRDDETAQ